VESDLAATGGDTGRLTPKEAGMGGDRKRFGVTGLILAGALASAPARAQQPEQPAQSPGQDEESKDPTSAPETETFHVERVERQAGGDAQKRYLLIQTAPVEERPEDGWKLLIVLPGGDGSAEFGDWVQRIATDGCPPGYLVAQLVAPVWRQGDGRIVWPTKGLPDDKMAFSTEFFVTSVVEDVQASHELDERHITLMGWSSGGPACYAALLDEKCPATGAFVAMSVFKPEQLPDAAEAKGKAVYVLHSPTDFISMRFPEDAVETLREGGAATHLETYEGGHGWQGDAFEKIEPGLEWIESNVTVEPAENETQPAPAQDAPAPAGR
jgi:predicted esterase